MTRQQATFSLHVCTLQNEPAVFTVSVQYRQDQSTTFITLRGGGRVVAIRGSAVAQRLPNIIIRSLALAYLLSTLNLLTHTSVFGEKKYIQNMIVIEQNYLSYILYIF